MTPLSHAKIVLWTGPVVQQLIAFLDNVPGNVILASFKASSEVRYDQKGISHADEHVLLGCDCQCMSQ